MNCNEFENDVINSSQLIYINIYLRDCKANTINAFGESELNLFNNLFPNIIDDVIPFIFD